VSIFCDQKTDEKSLWGIVDFMLVKIVIIGIAINRSLLS